MVGFRSGPQAEANTTVPTLLHPELYSQYCTHTTVSVSTVAASQPYLVGLRGGAGQAVTNGRHQDTARDQPAQHHDVRHHLRTWACGVCLWARACACRRAGLPQNPRHSSPLPARPAQAFQPLPCLLLPTHASLARYCCYCWPASAWHTHGCVCGQIGTHACAGARPARPRCAEQSRQSQWWWPARYKARHTHTRHTTVYERSHARPSRGITSSTPASAPASRSLGRS
jgi:hypothetical protein